MREKPPPDINQLPLFDLDKGARRVPIVVLHGAVEVAPVDETEVSAGDVSPDYDNDQSG